MSKQYKIRCRNCDEYFKSDDELATIRDYDSKKERYFKGCPECKTDIYLVFLE